ncbi:MAG: cytochrome c-type biogenesis protein [Burkholderiales bacterium]
MKTIVALLLCLFAALAAAQQPVDPALRERLKKLEEELRCLVCQNQTLADSNAPLAEDLRREVRELAAQGKNDEQIKEFLVQRYGDFVLYKPPVKETTWLLWFGPFVLLAGGLATWLVVLRRRRGATQEDAPDPKAVEEGVEKARELLDDPQP